MRLTTTTARRIVFVLQVARLQQEVLSMRHSVDSDQDSLAAQITLLRGVVTAMTRENMDLQK